MAQRWEYAVLVVAWGDTPEVFSANNRPLRPRPYLYDYLTQLGDSGWELAGVEGSRLFFKRPKA